VNAVRADRATASALSLTAWSGVHAADARIVFDGKRSQLRRARRLLKAGTMRLAFLAFLLPVTVSGCAITFGDDNPPPTVSPSPPKQTVQVTTSAPHQVHEMSASMSAQADENGVKVYAALLLGTDFVVLDPGDYFTATIGAETIVMTREPPTDTTVHYMATFPPITDAVDVVIAFHRPAGRDGAPYSLVRLAAPFEITSPIPASIRRSSSLAMTVTPPPQFDDGLYARFYGDCVGTNGGYPLAFDESGSASLPMTMVPVTGGLSTSGCSVRVEVRHDTIGQVDSAFQRDWDGTIGSMEGLQARSITVKLVP
jgi:hypothetical protein